MTQHLSTKRGYAPILAAVLALVAVPTLTGCDMLKKSPDEQTIPTDSNRWQQKLGDTFENLPEEERQLLSRYMLRMKLSDAYESGAMPRTTIKNAIMQQREYERLHPNNPTGKKSPVVADNNARSLAERYPIALLPVKPSDNDSLNQVKLQFMLSNHGKSPITHFEGELLMQDANLKIGKRFVIPSTAFEPAVAPEQSGKIVLESSIEDINVMRAIRNAQDVTIVIVDGTLMLEDGRTIRFSQR
ncbi:hypothetical protein [Psychrobacter aestuarii]|uniref:Lipoprotein n=1 Tax=Psychrobacter aestuarii TaxID=556327 RepID=A0ABN0VM15_9GAMM|nr:hypothetical protein [Psychrobacter aestuarii]